MAPSATLPAAISQRLRQPDPQYVSWVINVALPAPEIVQVIESAANPHGCWVSGKEKALER